MKKLFKIFFMIMLILIIFTFSITLAASKKIESVSVAGIETPYSTERVLDTTAEVENGVPYRVYEVAWKTPSSSSTGLYEVTVTLKANVGYTFSEDVTGTVNENPIISKYFEDEDELKITYAFPKQESSTSSSTVTLRHRIETYCDEEKGSISPYIVRVLHGNNQTITITPKEGYKIKDVKVDGESVGSVSEYTFKKVKENHTIRAYFEKIETSVDKEDEVEEIQKEKPILKYIKAILEIIKCK